MFRSGDAPFFEVDLLDLPLPRETTRGAARYGDFVPLGRGGKAEVWSCLDVVLGRRVAYKVLLPELAGNREEERLLLREARIMARLSHPAIPPVYDLGRDAQNRPYFTLQIAEGVGLEEILRQWANQPQAFPLEGDFERRLALGMRIVEAMAWAHQKGLAHGDLKPGNLLVAHRDAVVVLDWGLACHESEPRTPAVRGGLRHGSPGYLPPEMRCGAATLASKRSDVYQLGAILYELLTLEPFECRAGGSAIRFTTGPGRLRLDDGFDSRVAASLERACQRALHADREERFANAGQFARALREAHLDLLANFERIG
jgi:serine/threonine protein kinase